MLTSSLVFPRRNAPDSPVHPAPGRSVLLVLGVVGLLAALHLHYPLDEDQALFMYVARELADGARMYREYWDMKQPGIYWWYETVGDLFGFDARGLRWMDLLWSLAVAGVLWAALRRRGTLVAVLGPCLAFGCFYARTTPWHLSQVEWIVCGPIAVVLWCVGGVPPAVGGRTTALRFAVAGAMVAVAALFKSMAALIPLSMLAAAVALARWRDAWPWRALLKECLLPMLAGTAIVVLPLAAWMQINGTLAPALWTAFVYPPEAVKEYQHTSPTQLVLSLRWFIVGTAALGPWTLWAVYNGLRRGLRIELMCTAWCASAMAVNAMQVLSYWEYHFDLLFIPVGVLAALGFADVLDRLAARDRIGYRRAAMAMLVLGLAVSTGWPLARKTARVLVALPFSPEKQFAYESIIDTRRPGLMARVNAVKGLTKDSDRIIVWGDPRLYALVGRRPVLEVNGATFYLARQVEEAVALIRREPPALIYLGKLRDRMTRHAGGAFPRVVHELYEPVYDDDNGTWYRLRAAGG